MTATEQVILVDKEDNAVGLAEKMAAHQHNLCHRAFSVFVFRDASRQELLLQQRARHKYHSALLWTNTCCSHPRPGEDILLAGQRRLAEEMGITIPLTWLGKFHYIAHFENGLSENEIDHVLLGVLDNETFNVDPNEVHDYRWVRLVDLKQEMAQSPEKFTPWLKQALEIVGSPHPNLPPAEEETR